MENSLIQYRDETVTVNSYLPDGTTDEVAIQLWIDNHNSQNTRDAYTRDIRQFLAFTRYKPLREVTFVDLMGFRQNLLQGKQSSQVRTLSAIKSLLTFCHETGYISLNVGKVLKPGKAPSKLAGRILTEEQVLTMFALEEDPLKHCLLRTLYYGGLRVSELCSLVWADIVPNGQAGQLNVVGKGDKARSVPIPESPYQEILALRGDDAINAPVFARRTGNPLDRVQVFRIVKEAATRAGLPADTSPHWLRHAHATHALNHGATIQLVRDTLGHASVAVTDRYAHARPNTSSSTYLPI